MTITERAGVVLREVRTDDLAAIDQLTVDGYAGIQESYVAMLGEHIYQAVRHQPELTWEQRKCAQVTFWLFAEQQYGHIDNNALRSDERGQGWATFMYRSVLAHFRKLGLRFAHVDTGLDDAHSAARRPYESVGFDHQVPGVEYWQDLSTLKSGST